jgi:class 3 adenylate cyclase
VPTCSSCGQDNPEQARFCNACGSPLAPEAPALEVRKTLTLVFSDVAGSTALGEGRDPEAIRAVMQRYFAEMRRIVEHHGGIVEKFVGDAVMAAFGIPAAREDDPLRAVRAAAEMREAIGTLNEDFDRNWGMRLTVRIGVNTGPVVAGDPSSRQPFATGDTVNTAARLEQALLRERC